MGEFFNTILYEPLFNALIFLYDAIPGTDMGIAIILLTLVIKLLLFQPSLSALKAQKSLQDLQPKLREVQEKYKDNREELGKKTIEVYRTHKVNPFSSCLPILIQLPILWVLYRVFFNGIELDAESGLLMPNQVEHLYGYLQAKYATQAIDSTFLGLVDLSATGNVILAVLAGALQFWQTRMLQRTRPKVQTKGSRDEDLMANMNRQMLYVMPIITVIFGYQFPAGLALYWTVNILYSIGQQRFFLRKGHISPPSQEKLQTP